MTMQSGLPPYRIGILGIAAPIDAWIELQEILSHTGVHARARTRIGILLPHLNSLLSLFGNDWERAACRTRR